MTYDNAVTCTATQNTHEGCHVVPCVDCGTRWHILSHTAAGPFLCPRCDQ